MLSLCYLIHICNTCFIYNLGYAVASGHFVGLNDEVQGVAGAPRAKDTGKVTIYDIANKTVYQEIFGEKVSNYF